MARVRIEKEYIQKKNKIIMDAVDLLLEVGYESFSINKIISKTGIISLNKYFLTILITSER